MSLWITIILILIGVGFAVSIYRYDGSEFSKLTGYSYFTLFTDRKVKLTYKLNRYLKKVRGQHKVLFNVVIPNTNHKYDAILVHQSGIYMLDVLQMSGWIYGREQDAEWAEAKHKEQLKQFQNPIIESQKVLLDFDKLVPDINKDLLHSVIVFSNDCSFKTIEVHSENAHVIKLNELKECWKDESDVKLSNEEITKVYNALEQYMAFNVAPNKMGAATS